MNATQQLLVFASTLAFSLPTTSAADANEANRGAAAAKLPLSEVVLYSSGVGYFERVGEVEGRAQVDLRFKVDDINDLLKSMVVQDFNGGQVSTVTYGSRDPLTKTLKSFGLDLTENPTLGQLLNQARGERIEVFWPAKGVGTILGVEKKKQPVGEHKEIEVEYLNVLTEDGLQSIPFAQVQKVKLLNEQLNGELRQALAALAAGHDTQKKTVGLTFDGPGKRKVSVAYIAQTPVWKTSYRLVLSDQAKPFLQGWAIVENTSDEDWENVQLSLISGRPISFVMDLYQPLYTTRPVVQPELYLSLRPQVYGDTVEKLAELQMADDQMLKEGLARNSAGGFGGGARGIDPTTGAPLAPAAPALAGRYGLLRRSEARSDERELLAQTEARRELNLQQGVTAAAQVAQAGELFQYHIKTPVTLARQKSAMLPIINQNVEGTKLSIYNQSVQAKHPLYGFRLKNTTALHLLQGPLTVFEEGTYAGDARIEDLAPGQERLLSYGLDLKTEVEPQVGSGRNELLTVKIRKGTLIATRKASEEKSYNVRNRDQKRKTILIEHPFRSDWEIVEPKDKPERTRDVYRFSVAVDPDKTSKLVVHEEKQFDERVQLINANTDAIAYYVRAPKVSAKVKDALQKAAQLRDRLSQTGAERTRREHRTNEITQEQGRIRENMAKLNANSELYVRYVKKLDQQETELERLREEIEELKNTETQQQRDLNDYLLNLNVE
ncbi:MAG: DUF4139 domain-containing protein [Verrucomicrobiales bacterium]|nr:DUF4139 domain-containing protein [Verrucomicrobiales bacterium]